MTTRIYAPRETTYQAPRYATTKMVGYLEWLLTEHNLYFNEFDRLWKLLEAHRIDEQNPGDGARIPFEQASKAIDYVKAYIAKSSGPSWQESSPLTPTVLAARQRQEQQNQPATEVPAQPAPLESKAPTAVKYGVYRFEGQVYIVVENKAKTKTYAKRMAESAPRLTGHGEEVDFEWEYAPGVIWKLTEEHRMSLEDARDLMIKYGRCLKCRKHLKAAKTLKTVEETGQMIGPVCRKYFA